MKKILLGTGLTLLASAIIVGCNSNSSDGTMPSSAASTTTLTVTPSLGQIKNARVKLFNAKTGAQIGDVNGVPVDNTTGKAKFDNVPVGVPVIASVLPLAGQTTVDYFDEAEKVVKTITQSQLGNLRAVVPSVAANQNVGVTAFTEAAAASLNIPSSNMITNPATAITNANNAVKQKVKDLFKADIDILTAPTVVGSTSNLTGLSNTTSGQYAGLLALAAETVTKLKGVDPANPASLKFLEELRKDAADGTLDGAGTGVDLNVFSTQFTTAQTSAAQALKSSLTGLGGFFTTITFSGGTAANCGGADCGSVTTSDNVVHAVKTVAVVSVNSMTTITWADADGNSLTLMLDAANKPLSLSTASADGAGFLACTGTACSGVTVDATNKTVTLNNVVLNDIGANATGTTTFKTGTLKYNVTSTGGSGQSCLATINYTITGVPVVGTASGSYKVCYNNFPQNAVCGASNAQLSALASGVNVPTGYPGGSATYSYAFNPVANCASSGAMVTVNYQ